MIGQRILRPETAFSVSPKGKRRPREHNHKHLEFIRGLRCCICGSPGPDAAHIRSASPLHGKPDTGMQEKPGDKWCVPLCRKHHAEQHSMAELAFWRVYGIDPFGLALALHHATGDDEIAEVILRSHIKQIDAT
jgi:hypothetical protein